LSSNRLKVAKSEGSIERFQVGKLRRSIWLAMQGLDCEPQLADPLARAVAMYVRGRRSAAMLTTGDVFECAQTVLDDTGLGEVSRRLAEHRRQRVGRRRRLLVADFERADAECVGWSKQRVVDAIERQYRLRHPVARIIGGEVEKRVLELDFKVVSTTLVREIVRNELLAWGLVSDEVLQGKLTFD
jgi:hypothetical protein